MSGLRVSDFGCQVVGVDSVRPVRVPHAVTRDKSSSGKPYPYLTIILLLIFLSACTRQQSTLRIAFTSMPESFDPVDLRSNYYSHRINENIFETLAVYKNDRLHNLLVENWHTIEYDDLKIKLKDNINFSDGSLLTVDDVIASCEYALQNPYSRVYNKVFLDSIVVDSDGWIIFYQNRDKPPSVGNLLIYLKIMKAEYISKGAEFLKENPMGTGAYYLDSVTDDTIILKKNIYHRNYINNSSVPDIVSITNEIDPKKKFQMLEENQIDFYYYLPITKYHEALNSDKYKIIEIESTAVIYLMLNPGSAQSSDINLKVNPLKDVRVRRAIAHAINIKDIFEKELYSKGNLLVIPALASGYGYPIEKEIYQYDIELSRKLMAQAGFAKGFSMGMKFREGDISYLYAKYIKDSLKEINIDVELDLRSNADFSNSFETHFTSSHINYYQGSVAPSVMYELRAALGYGARNYYHIENPRLLEIFAMLNYMPINDSHSRELFKELTDIVYDEVYIIPLSNPHDIHLLNKRYQYHKTTGLTFTDFKLVQ